MDAKLFGKWPYDVQVSDLGLKPYMNLKPTVIPKTCGRVRNKPLVELLIAHMMVPGHKGKKHKITSGLCTGKYTTVYGIVEDAFNLMEQRTKKNPLEVLVKAIENSAPYELTISQQIGGIVARKPAICAPKKRLDLVMRRLVQGSYSKAFNSKKGMTEALASELVAAYKNSTESFAVAERQRNEKEAEGAR
ncbi:MAG: 30S ribosomal protein S7 [Candidatus Aenigmarchaeota archaeon]|nr:30S ribosomal protein S7 [Candidatus Aenigmarchaeota archaeon]